MTISGFFTRRRFFAALLATAIIVSRFPIEVTQAAVQTLTVTASSAAEASGWLAEAGDCTRFTSDDGDTSRLYTPTNNDTHYCVTSNTSGLGGSTINSYTAYAKCRSLDPVSNTFQIGLKIGGVNYYSANKDTVTSTSYILFSNTWAVSPATGIAFTTTEIDGLEMGLKKTNAVGMGCTYMYGEVDYTAAAPASSEPFVPKVMWYF